MPLAVLASQAVSSAEPGRMGECVNLLVKNRQQRWHIEGMKKGNHRWIAERSPWFAVGLADKDCQ